MYIKILFTNATPSYIVIVSVFNERNPKRCCHLLRSLGTLTFRTLCMCVCVHISLYAHTHKTKCGQYIFRLLKTFTNVRVCFPFPCIYWLYNKHQTKLFVVFTSVHPELNLALVDISFYPSEISEIELPIEPMLYRLIASFKFQVFVAYVRNK